MKGRSPKLAGKSVKCDVRSEDVGKEILGAVLGVVVMVEVRLRGGGGSFRLKGLDAVVLIVPWRGDNA